MKLLLLMMSSVFYGYAVNQESARDVYSKQRIIAVTDLQIMEWHDYKHLDWISVRRDDDQIYKFKEGDFKRLRLHDIEDMLLLLKKLNLTRPDTYRSDLKRREAYTAYSNPRGFIYQNKDKKNRLMRIDELHKFSDGTLNDVRNALNDRLKGIRMQYLPSTIWRKGDKDRAAAMIQAIEKMLKTRRIMRSLEKFVGGRLKIHTLAGNYVKEILLKLNLPDDRSILTDSQVTPTKHGRITKPCSSHCFIANCFNARYLKMEGKVIIMPRATIGDTSLTHYYIPWNRGKAIVNSPQPIYDQEPSIVTKDDETSKDKEIDKLMALISLSISNVDGARETVGSTVVHKSGIQCYNCKEFGHVERECQKPKRVKDAVYHMEKMLLCKQEEAKIQLNAEQADWRDDTDDELEDQELEAHYMYMAQLQEVSPDAADSGPIFDDEPLQKVSNDDHYNVFAIESEHLEQFESVHDTYPIQQDAHNVIIDSLDMSYDREDIDQNDDDNDLVNERELLASLIE
nr:hypothetical protein [Tanacetum cinerariifolium]